MVIHFILHAIGLKPKLSDCWVCRRCKAWNMQP